MNNFLFVPARVESKRLYNKLNKKILNNKTALEYLLCKVLDAKIFKKIIVVTPNTDSFKYLEKYKKINLIKSVGRHISGIDRIGSVVKNFNIKRLFILFADETLIKKKTIKNFVAKVKKKNETNTIFNAVNINLKKKYNNKSFVKVISKAGKIIDFKRHITRNNKTYKKKISISVGLFSLSKKILMHAMNLEKTKNQIKTSIEQFKYLDNSIKMKVIEVDHPFPSLNSKEDFIEIKKIIRKES